MLCLATEVTFGRGATPIWTRSADLHTGPRRVNGRIMRPDTRQHLTTCLNLRNHLHQSGRPHTIDRSRCRSTSLQIEQRVLCQPVCPQGAAACSIRFAEFTPLYRFRSRMSEHPPLSSMNSTPARGVPFMTSGPAAARFTYFGLVALPILPRATFEAAVDVGGAIVRAAAALLRRTPG